VTHALIIETTVADAKGYTNEYNKLIINIHFIEFIKNKF
jgi:hypothetical protein